MASVTDCGNGNRRIHFIDLTGERQGFRLKATAKQGATIAGHVEAILHAKQNNCTMPAETSAWLAGIGDDLHAKLAKVGLVSSRESIKVPTLDEFIRGYIAQRKDLKPATVTVLEQCRIWLVRFSGEDRRIDTVTSADADAYKAHMIETGLAKAYIAKRLRYARHFFGVAIRRGLVKVNPFGHLSVQVKGDPSRRVFVPGDVVKRVMDAVTDPQWKLLIALARWGGLRIPSEALALTWKDVDFEGKRFIVRASKTEHHADGGIRVVPMFPELVPLFQAVFEESAAEGAVHVISRYRDPKQNVRTQLKRYAERAGVKLWGKPWQNMRVSRATELADLFPSHVCAAWLGHTEKIADAFYRQVTDDHFAKAVRGYAPAAQLEAHGASGGGEDGEGADAPARPAARQTAQHDAVSSRNVSDASDENPQNALNLRDFSNTYENVHIKILGDTGLEPVTSAV